MTTPEKPADAAAKCYAAKPADYFGVVRDDALGLMDPRGKRVLDVGCGSGVSGAALKQRGAGAVVGIEFDEAAAKRAETVLDRVLTGNVDTLPLDFAPCSFDLIVCLDVLEHLPYPEETLRRLLPFLAPDGEVLVSLPNIRYAGTLKKLIWEADWPRLPSGIFDGTHLRWFTDKAARRMFAEAGLTVIARRRNTVGLLADFMARFPIFRLFVSDWVTVQFLYLTRRKEN